MYSARSRQTDPLPWRCWLSLLLKGLRADVFRTQCAQRGVLVSEASSFSARPGSAPNAVRICLSHEPSELRLEQGLRKIANLMREPSRYALSI